MLFNLLAFEPMNFIKNLQWMGKGMLAIIIVMGILIIITGLLNKIGNKKK
jgi:hypothetical protein